MKKMMKMIVMMFHLPPRKEFKPNNKLNLLLVNKSLKMPQWLKKMMKMIVMMSHPHQRREFKLNKPNPLKNKCKWMKKKKILMKKKL